MQRTDTSVAGKKTALSLIIICFFYCSATGCTLFVLKNSKTLLVGKNLDWSCGKGFACVNPRGMRKQAMTCGSGRALAWTSRYGSVTFNQFGRGFPLGGINEKGLVVEEASLNTSRYPAVKQKFAVNELQWIQYQLDCHTTVDQVINSFADLSVSPCLVPVHYLVADRSGDCAVIEFVSKTLKVYRRKSLPYAVLSNNAYDRSLKYLQLHRGFGGDRELHAGAGSQERFVRAVMLQQNLQKSGNSLKAGHGFAILDRVSQHDTRWSIVYDNRNMCVTFRTFLQTEPRRTDVENQDFSFSQTKFFDLNQAGPIRFVPLSDKANRQLLEQVFAKLVKEGDLEKEQQKSCIDALMRHS